MVDIPQTPVVTTARAADTRRVARFIEHLRSDPQAVAQYEAQRLKSYLRAFSQVLQQGLQDHPDAYKKFSPHADVPALIKPAKLSHLFNKVAATSRNVILSEMMIVPQAMLKNAGLNKWNTLFSGAVTHRGQAMTLGFLQIFTDQYKRDHSVSLPVFALSDDAMNAVAPYRPQRMLEAFQVVMSAGNHDMQHHFTNRMINDDIAHPVTSQEQLMTGKKMLEWAEKSFADQGDAHPRSYESWLMLSHARVRCRMSDGAEGKALAVAVDVFFEELTRIQQEASVARKRLRAHAVPEAIDYFGTALGFALMRFVPLDHDLMRRLLGQMEQLVPSDSLPMYLDMQTNADVRAKREQDVSGVLKQYAKKGGFQPNEYEAEKLSDIIALGPWIAHLLCPYTTEPVLKSSQERAQSVAVQMIGVAAEASGVIPDGEYSFYDGPKNVTLRYRNQQLEGGVLPAVEWASERESYQLWRKGGVTSRDDGPAEIKRDGGISEETYLLDGLRHRKDGPAYTGTSAVVTEHVWYWRGKKHRADGPAVALVWICGQETYEYYKHGVLNRDDGPAWIEKNQRMHEEKYYRNGKLDRADGPAHTYISADFKEYVFYCKDSLHRDNGPAKITVDKKGKVTELWYRQGVEFVPSAEQVSQYRASGERERLLASAAEITKAQISGKFAPDRRRPDMRKLPGSI